MARQNRLGPSRWIRMGVISTAAVVLLMSGVVGCQEGVGWHDYDYPRVLADSQANKKLMFVYFRDFASVDCTKFEDGVLMLPPAKSALRPFYSVPLQWNTLVDAPLAERWQIRSVPAYVILDPSERVLAKRTPPITLEQLLQDLNRTQAEFRGEPAQPTPKTAAQPAAQSANP